MNFVGLRIEHDDLRVQVFFVLDNDGFFCCRCVWFTSLGDRDAGDHVAELDLTGLLRDDQARCMDPRSRVCSPFFDLSSPSALEITEPSDHLVALQFAAIRASMDGEECRSW